MVNKGIFDKMICYLYSVFPILLVMIIVSLRQQMSDSALPLTASCSVNLIFCGEFPQEFASAKIFLSR